MRNPRDEVHWIAKSYAASRRMTHAVARTYMGTDVQWTMAAAPGNGRFQEPGEAVI